MTRALLTVVTLAVFSISAWAEGYAYHARIEGMVCAFCAYNVGKTIGALPGVEAESVHVDLESKLVDFNATAPVDFFSVSAAFSDSGFTLAKLEVVEIPAARSMSFEEAPVVVLDLESVDISLFEAVLETLGAVASSQGMRLVIEAPEAVEIDLLMPILMGRKPAINVRFVPIESNSIHLKMFAASNGT